MSRPPTEAALYQRFEVRLPVEVAAAVRTRAARSGESLNTVIIAMLRRGFRLPRPVPSEASLGPLARLVPVQNGTDTAAPGG